MINVRTLIAALMVVSFAAGAALAQKAPEPKIGAPAKPTELPQPPKLLLATIPYGESPQIFCSNEDKAAEVAKWTDLVEAYEADKATLETWQKDQAARIAMLQSAGQLDQARRLTENLAKTQKLTEEIRYRLGRVKEMLSRVKFQPVVDCTRPDGFMPKPPTMTPVPWVKLDKFCSEEALMAYREALNKAHSKTARNLSNAKYYFATLYGISMQAADPKSPLARWKDTIDKAIQAADRIYKQAELDNDEVEKEVDRIRNVQPESCPGPSQPSDHLAPGGPGAREPPPPLERGRTPPPPPPPGPKKDEIAPEHSCAPRAPTPLESGMLRELDAVRADPPAYAGRMPALPYVDKTGAVAALKQQAAEPAVVYNACLASVAIAQAQDQGPKGGASHVGSDGSRPNERMKAAGVDAGQYAEVIAIFYPTAAGMMEQLLVDQPGAAHPHRDEIFDPNLTEAGVGCGPNAKFGVMCVVDMASSPLAKGGGGAGFTNSQRVTNSCWIDAKTGERVKTYPQGTEDFGDPNHRSRPTHVNADGTTIPGRDFVRLPDGSWIDAKTGEAVNTYPQGTEDFGDPNHRSRPTHVNADGTTIPGRDFVRVPCPP